VKSFDVQYTGSLEEGIFFSEEEFTKALRAIVKLHYCYVLAMMVEPVTVSNPSARLLERMSIVLGETVGFLLGEKEKDDAIYRESKRTFLRLGARVRGKRRCAHRGRNLRAVESRLFRPQSGEQPHFAAQRSEADAEGQLGRNVPARQIQETRVKAAADVWVIGRRMSLLVERFAPPTDVLKPGVAVDEIVQCVKTLRRSLWKTVWTTREI